MSKRIKEIRDNPEIGEYRGHLDVSVDFHDPAPGLTRIYQQLIDSGDAKPRLVGMWLKNLVPGIEAAFADFERQDLGMEDAVNAQLATTALLTSFMIGAGVEPEDRVKAAVDLSNAFGASVVGMTRENCPECKSSEAFQPFDADEETAGTSVPSFGNTIH